MDASDSQPLAEAALKQHHRQRSCTRCQGPEDRTAAYPKPRDRSPKAHAKDASASPRPSRNGVSAQENAPIHSSPSARDSFSNAKAALRLTTGSGPLSRTKKGPRAAPRNRQPFTFAGRSQSHRHHDIPAFIGPVGGQQRTRIRIDHRHLNLLAIDHTKNIQ